MICLSVEKMEFEYGDRRRTFDGSLKPLLICLNLLGIRIPRDSSITIAVITRFFGLLIFLSNLLINSLIFRGYLYSVFQSYIPEFHGDVYKFAKSNGYSLLCTLMLTLIIFFSAPLIHFYLIITAFFTRCWGNLWMHLQRVEREMNLSDEFHRRCRIRCYLAFTLFLVTVNGN